MQRLRLPAKMGRAKLMRWTERLMEAQDLADAVETIRRMAKASPPPVPVPGRPFKPDHSWRKMLYRTAQGLADHDPYLPLISWEGNDKLPFWSWSTLPIFTCPGAGECADWCYSLTAWRVAGPWCRQAQNTLLLRFDKALVEQSFRIVPDGSTLRLYVDGDFDSVETLDFWMRMLRSRPSIRAYGYSKSWDVVWQWWQDVGRVVGVPNYRLNLSTGGRAQRTTREEMLSLPFVRGEFVSIPVDYPRSINGSPVGFGRYDDPAYHQAVRKSAQRIGLKVFSCPGKCGECCGGQHACGSDKFKGVTIAIGLH